MKNRIPFLIFAVILLLLANVGLWLSRTLYNPENFSSITIETFQKPEVRDAIATQIVDKTLADRPLAEQVIGDPVRNAISGALESQTFKSIFERLAIRFQKYLTTSNKEDVTIEVGQLSTFINNIAAAISPQLSEQVPDVPLRTITLVESESLPDINRYLKPFVNLGPIAGLLSLIIIIYLTYISENRLQILRKISQYFLIGILLFSLTIPYARTVLQGNTSNQEAQIVITATYDAFAEVLIRQLAILGVIFGAIQISIYLYQHKKKKELSQK